MRVATDPPVELELSDDEEDGAAQTSWSNGIFSRLSNRISTGLTGGHVLEKTDLEPILKQFKEQLMSKNVASDVADKLCDSVEESLVGQKTARWTSAKRTVKLALVEAISKLLTPKKSIDVMRAALTAKANSKVYTIAFLGVNGVGKSTNLAKVAFHLKHKAGLSVMIAACDTFRAGAVEQLKVHARNLDVQLFEKGYPFSESLTPPLQRLYRAGA